MKNKIEVVLDFWDFPIGGIAKFNQRYHVYECLFDEEKDYFSNTFRLQEIGEEIFQLIQLEDELKTKWDNKIYKS